MHRLSVISSTKLAGTVTEENRL
jgi:hypothetical protein